MSPFHLSFEFELWINSYVIKSSDRRPFLFDWGAFYLQKDVKVFYGKIKPKGNCRIYSFFQLLQSQLCGEKLMNHSTFKPILPYFTRKLEFALKVCFVVFIESNINKVWHPAIWVQISQSAQKRTSSTPDWIEINLALPNVAQRLLRGSFFYRVVASWKSVTGQTRNSSSIPCFKKRAKVEISCT